MLVTIFMRIFNIIVVGDVQYRVKYPPVSMATFIIPLTIILWTEGSKIPSRQRVPVFPINYWIEGSQLMAPHVGVCV